MHLSLVSSLAFGFAERVPYRVAPLFLIRQAGVPFEMLEGLATPRTCEVARRLISNVDDDKTGLSAELERELVSVRKQLWQAGRTRLAPYLVFAVRGVRELLAHMLEPSGIQRIQLEHRNSRAGDRERHLLLYLQRIAAKNDTVSEFGPSGWGVVDKNVS